MNKGTLYIVATPIGNLDDITLRAIETLKSVDLIACEDTRVSRVLLDHFGIKKELISLHQHSDDKKLQEIIDRLNCGENIAYITDGGTPGISDPGSALVRTVQNTRNPSTPLGASKIQGYKQNPESKNCHSEQPRKLAGAGEESQGSEILLRQTADQDDIKVIPIPGPSALAAAVSVSGLVEKEFYFAGFLPKKKGRQSKFVQLDKLVKLDIPIVIYESALRVEKTLKDIEQYFGKDCEVFIAREMTKMFEEYWGGRVHNIIEELSEHKLKGEVTIVVKR
jgi:16S rRNA (cytidine1402-2'-O)-methyltransferase